MEKQSFIDSLLTLPSSNRSALYKRSDISEKIQVMSSPIPLGKAERLRWQRLHLRYKIVPYQSVIVLYLRCSGEDSIDKRVLSIEELYDVMKRTHIDHKHVRKLGLYKRLVREYHGVTEKACHIFLQGCEECHLRKSKKSVKSLVIKPISSTRFLSRCQVDLIDFRDMSEEHNRSESGIPFKWLLVYQDHFTKYLLLRPLKRKSANEVAEILDTIFCELGPPHILQSDNGGEFCNSTLFNLINHKWYSTKIVHGKPRHPESQGSVERANREVKNALGSKMRENSNDLCWIRYLARVQFEKNTTHHSTIGMTPYEALYNHKPSFGLSDFGIPSEIASDIHTEQDLECIINSINATAGTNSKSTSKHIFNDDSLSSQLSFSEPVMEQAPVYPLSPDPYLDDISQPVPNETRIFEPTSSNIPFAPLNCIVCGDPSSSAHSCPGCEGSIHVICGRSEEEEGYGTPVWCPKCDLNVLSKKANCIRTGVKRNQEKLHERMIQSTAKRFHPANIGDNVIIPIERPDRVNSLGQRNLMGIVTDMQDDNYTIGTREGIINTEYSRNQFEVCSSQFIQPSTIPPNTISQTTAMRKASLGIEGGAFCRCSHCKTNRCPCKKSSRTCNTKCHKGAKCFNA